MTGSAVVGLSGEVKLGGFTSPEEILVLTQEEEDRRAVKETTLWRFNLACGILHFIIAILVLAAGLSNGNAGKFAIPAITSYPDWSKGFPVPATQFRYNVKFTALTSGFSWMSAAAHFLVLIFWKVYVRDLRQGINQFRWFEYAASSSLMIVMIAMLFGLWDVNAQFLMGSVNACMNFFGYSHEVQNKQGKRVDWTNFIFGCFAGVVPWAVIIDHLAQGSGKGMPGFVWGVFGAYLFFFNTFPVNMILQYAHIGRWYKDSYFNFPGGGYYFGEMVYQILSLVSKTLLVALVVGGSNQPNSNTSGN